MAVGRPQGSLGLSAGKSPSFESSPCSRQTWWLGTGIFWFLHEWLFPRFIQLTFFWAHGMILYPYESLLPNSIHNSISLLLNQNQVNMVQEDHQGCYTFVCRGLFFASTCNSIKSYSRQVRKKRLWLSMHWARFLNVKFNIFINALNKTFTKLPPPFLLTLLPSSFIHSYLNVFICTTWKHGPVCTAVLYIHRYSVSCGFCTFKAHPPAAACHYPGRQV